MNFFVISAALLLCLMAALDAADCRSPNIILVLTDDVDVQLGSYQIMNKTRTLIEQQGMRFDNAFVTTTICCPSRSSIMTGRYQHNHNVVNNTIEGNCNGLDWRTNLEPFSFGKLLHDRGYSTFYSGKYLNQYGYDFAGGVQHVPPGWDFWAGLVGNSAFYHYALSINGTLKNNGNAPEDYLTDVIRDYALQFLNESVAAQPDKPFLMVCAPPAAHVPFSPAPRHENTFLDARAPRTAAFGVHDESKSWLVSQAPPLDENSTDFIDHIYQKRLATLLSVDDLVEAVTLRVEELGLLDNTYIIFTSDHGFHMGQFNMRYDKRLPYDTDLRVPFVIRGPRIDAGTVTQWPTLNIDLAPTFVDLAGGQIPAYMDGQSFANVLYAPQLAPNSREFLVEYHGEASCSNATACQQFIDTIRIDTDTYTTTTVTDVRNNTYLCLRRVNVAASNCTDCLMCDYIDDTFTSELYDLSVDPDELHNLVSPSSLAQMAKDFAVSSMKSENLEEVDDKIFRVANAYTEMHQRVKELQHCTGRGCHN